MQSVSVARVATRARAAPGSPPCSRRRSDSLRVHDLRECRSELRGEDGSHELAVCALVQEGQPRAENLQERAGRDIEEHGHLDDREPQAHHRLRRAELLRPASARNRERGSSVERRGLGLAELQLRRVLWRVVLAVPRRHPRKLRIAPALLAGVAAHNLPPGTEGQQRLEGRELRAELDKRASRREHARILVPRHRRTRSLPITS